jgi:sugar (pentulose or hexulose) kinase
VLADVFARRVATLASHEGSAYGAALLAMAGTGEFASVPELCEALIKEDAQLEPGPDAAVYARGHQIYKAAYPALKQLFPRM